MKRVVVEIYGGLVDGVYTEDQDDIEVIVLDYDVAENENDGKVAAKTLYVRSLAKLSEESQGAIEKMERRNRRFSTFGDTTRPAKEFREEYSLIVDSQDIEATLEYLDVNAISDLGMTIGSMFVMVDERGGDIKEAWVSQYAVPYDTTEYKLIP